MVTTNILSCLEPCLGIINACLPVLQPALAKTFGSSAFEWTRRSPMSVSSAKTTTSLWSRWPSRMNTAGERWPQRPSCQRTKSSATNKTWPMSNERRVVRFKDVEWGDYFPRRVNTVPMSIYHHPGAECMRGEASDFDDWEGSDGRVSPCNTKATSEVHKSVDSTVSCHSQYWD